MSPLSKAILPEFSVFGSATTESCSRLKMIPCESSESATAQKPIVNKSDGRRYMAPKSVRPLASCDTSIGCVFILVVRALAQVQLRSSTATVPTCQEFCAFKRKHFRSPFTIRAKVTTQAGPQSPARVVDGVE